MVRNSDENVVILHNGDHISTQYNSMVNSSCTVAIHSQRIDSSHVKFANILDQLHVILSHSLSIDSGKV